MLFRMITVASLVSVALLGCSQNTGPAPAPTAVTTAPEPQNKWLLSSEPANAATVVEARKAIKDGDDVVITGRIGGAVDPWVKGRAAFSIVDQTLVPCSERPGDSCTTPWDYCCDTDRLPKSLATIKFVDEQGKTISTDARELFAVKELQTVVVKGKAKRDEAGNLTVLGTGLYVKSKTEPK